MNNGEVSYRAYEELLDDTGVKLVVDAPLHLYLVADWSIVVVW
jgi:hypothetical protein